jgi:hypothetical protein
MIVCSRRDQAEDGFDRLQEYLYACHGVFMVDIVSSGFSALAQGKI